MKKTKSFQHIILNTVSICYAYITLLIMFLPVDFGNSDNLCPSESGTIHVFQEQAKCIIHIPMTPKPINMKLSYLSRPLIESSILEETGG
jgi:hypothetical protein